MMLNCSKDFCWTLRFLVRDFGVWYAIFGKSTRFGTRFVVDNQRGTRWTRFFSTFMYEKKNTNESVGEGRNTKKSCKSRPQKNVVKFLLGWTWGFWRVFVGVFVGFLDDHWLGVFGVFGNT